MADETGVAAGKVDEFDAEEAIAARAGGDPDDLTVRVLAAAVAAVTRVAAEYWLDNDEAVFTDILQVAVRQATGIMDSRTADRGTTDDGSADGRARTVRTQPEEQP
ncbi:MULTISPECIES: hypothetical protein [Protofrankia]|uniref:MftR C-terminal domain-containing protein n=1 Tax=Protofrankia coriariae TaxID=1562887 RepID=A0ABR5EYK5_9ACTN|nr:MULTISPECIES: hypothetical protein [Protofrankia]KLL09556.1 hypothetical protein FrCorBMG51_24070 [Protofrankia coriariae]ONH32062.1 hypothetical protein BL254_22280 [Protofrankia sp. BMG5.30]